MFERIMVELRRPATAIALLIAIATTLIGLCFSFYFYSKSIRKGVIYYEVNQQLVFDQLNFAKYRSHDDWPVKIFDRNGTQITANIYVANIKVWNGGNDEIHKDDVRSNYELDTSNPQALISITMFDQTNSNADNFRVDKTNAILWDHFDAGDGFQLRVVYADNDLASITVGGRAANSGAPQNVAHSDGAFASRPWSSCCPHCAAVWTPPNRTFRRPHISQ